MSTPDPFRPPNYVDPANNAETTVSQSDNNNNESNQTAPSNSIIISKRFPLNIENEGAPYVMFKIYEVASQGAINQNINELKDSSSVAVRGYTTAAVNTGEVVSDYIPGFVSEAAAALIPDFVKNKYNEVISSGVEQAKSDLKNIALRRNIDQLKSAIALMMPDGLAANYEHNYDELSLTSVLGGAGAIAQAIQSETGQVSTKNSAVVEGLAKTIAGKFPLVQESEELTNVLIYGATGRTINPQLELLYSSPRLRTFTFDFLFIPKSRAEAQELDQILYLLRYYAAPTIPEGTTGRFMIPPAQFEIEFYHKNALNDYLFKTKKCVLESLSYDYSPNGYASFRDGFPVQTRLQMTFKETVIMDRNAIRAEKRNANQIESSFTNRG